MARFYNCPMIYSYSYCCRSLGLRLKACHLAATHPRN